MTRIGTVVGGWLAVLILGSPQQLAADENGRSTTPNTLVEMAYAAELSGQAGVRAALLEQVLKTSARLAIPISAAPPS